MFRNHKDIPVQYRRLILEETLSKRVSKVPLNVCNEIIANHLEMEAENETLKNYQIEFIKKGKHKTIEVVGRKKTLVWLDRILEYGENKDPKIVIAVRQAGRLIAGYFNCKWIEPSPRDKLIVKQAS